MRNKAFTLIELSIVIVIIGLIIGGVLVGRDLIEAAEARSVMSQMEKYQAAANTFRIKYNCKAGDCANATLLGLGRNGTGDKIIGAKFGQGPTTYPVCLRGGTPDGCMTDRVAGLNIWQISRSFGEHQQFWAHLSAAGLIESSIISLPNATGGLDAIKDTIYPQDALGKHHLAVSTWNYKLYIRTGIEFLNNSGQTYYSSNGTISSAQMFKLASKFDYPVYVGATNNHPTALVKGQRIVPLSSNPDNPTVQYNFYRPPNVSGGAPACVVSDGAGGYQYNIQNGGRCDLLWELNY